MAKINLSTLKQLAETLTPSAIEGVMRRQLTRVVREEIGQEAAKEIYRNAGFDFDDSWFDSLYNQVSDKEYRMGRVRYVNRSSSISEGVLDVGIADFNAKYRFTFEYEIKDALTDTWSKRHIALKTNELGTRAELENEMLGNILQASPQIADRIRSVSIRYGEINPLDA